MSATILDIIKSRCDTVESSSSVFYAHDGSASRVRAGQVLFHADDPSDSVYFLVDGDAKGCLGEGDVLVTTSLLRAPAVFGDRDVLAGCPARETVQFVTSGRVVCGSGSASSMRGDMTLSYASCLRSTSRAVMSQASSSKRCDAFRAKRVSRTSFTRFSVARRRPTRTRSWVQVAYRGARSRGA